MFDYNLNSLYFGIKSKIGYEKNYKEIQEYVINTV